MLEMLARRWWVVLIRGLAAIGLGTLAVLWPGTTMLSLLFVFGAFTVADGLTALWLGFSAPRDGRVWWEMVAVGAVAILFGLAVALLPGLTAVFFVYLIGFFAILRGVTEIAAAIQLRHVIDDEWMLILSGAVSILFGFMLIVRPGEGAIAMVLLIGAFMIAAGAMTVALALRLRHISQRLEARHPPA